MKKIKKGLVKKEELLNGNYKEIYSDGKIIYRNKNGKIHRDDDLPAVIDPVNGTTEWYKSGEQHREGAPAILYNLRDLDKDNASWIFNGKRHRLDGPAVDWKIRKNWFVNGIDITDWIKYYTKKYLILYPFEPNKHVVAELNIDKSKIIKDILEHIKKYNSADIALPLINMFKTLGVKWPELNSIEKSTKGINESISNNKKIPPNYEKYLIKLLQTTKNIDDLINHIKFAINQDYSISGLHNLYSMPEIETLFIKWFDNDLTSFNGSIKYNKAEQIIDFLYILIQYSIDPNWPNLKKFLNRHKNIFVIPLLKRIKNNIINGFDIPIHSINVDIEVLRHFGVNWLELYSIEKSINNGKKLLSHFDDPPENLNEIANSRYQKFVEHDDLIKLQIRMTDPSDASDLLDWIELMEKSGYTYSQISNTLSEPSTVKLIKYWIDYIIKYGRISNIETILHTLEIMSQEKEIHVVWEKTNIPFESNKHAIIKELLIMIKDYMSNEYILKYINALKYFNCEWPELDIIEKSLRHKK